MPTVRVSALILIAGWQEDIRPEKNTFHYSEEFELFDTFS